MHTADKPLMLVTGSSGLIGSLVVEEFKNDFTVVGIDLKPPEEAAAADFVQCDLTSDDDTERAFNEIRRDYGNHLASMIHLAAYYDFSGEPSPLYRKLTVEGTRRVLRELRKFDPVEQFVFTSTLLVMEQAESEEDVITEEAPLEDDPWNYPGSKIAAEEVIRAEHGDIPSVVLRIAGAYDEEGHSIPIVQHIARVYEKQLESYFFPGNPEHGTPYVHLKDLVACFRKVVDQREWLSSFEVFLIAEPELMSHSELQETIGELVHGKEWPTIRIPRIAARAGAWVKEKLSKEETFIRPWMVDLADAHYPVAIRRAEERLHWIPEHRLSDTLPAMVRTLKEDPARFYESNGLPIPDELHESEPHK